MLFIDKNGQVKSSELSMYRHYVECLMNSFTRAMEVFVFFFLAFLVQSSILESSRN